MNTEIVKIEDAQRDLPLIRRAADVLLAGGLVALPTETVYGLAANALDKNAVRKIFAAKGRPQDNPLIVHVAGLKELEPLVARFPDKAALLAEEFWPGPLTMVLPKSGLIPDAVSAGLPTVAVRMPSHPVMRAVISVSGLPLAAPSANRSGHPSPTEARHCIDDLSGKVDMIIDGGECSVGLESTVISLACEPPLLLRPGAVTLEQLRAVLDDVECDGAVSGRMNENTQASSPGMKYKHYAPDAKITLVHGAFESFARLLSEQNGSAALVFDGEEPLLPQICCIAYGPKNDPAHQARHLFSALRELDTRGFRRVYARAPKPHGMGLAVYNRLLRAAAFDEIYL